MITKLLAGLLAGYDVFTLSSVRIFLISGLRSCVKGYTFRFGEMWCLAPLLVLIFMFGRL